MWKFRKNKIYQHLLYVMKIAFRWFFVWHWITKKPWADISCFILFRVDCSRNGCGILSIIEERSNHYIGNVSRTNHFGGIRFVAYFLVIQIYPSCVTCRDVVYRFYSSDFFVLSYNVITSPFWASSKLCRIHLKQLFYCIALWDIPKHSNHRNNEKSHLKFS